ncbi:WXG100 family type VII secretion target [Actinomyces gaoshouyii]|uniref:WXG100 family type VII secretion target n=1 Tax=Actinomyces gaoshouyii TaxID=1960083 RepID=UPI0009C09765|nr:hypothetical protein [Actinomyces gaoshouyii]ARD42842.1 hypothetical protein B6G06_09470 [Actinomyces gaoshouyii]
MKFDMAESALAELARKTSTSHDDLGSLVKKLVAAAEPLEGRFNGAARAAFDSFKGRTDQVANDLNGALASVLGGIKGMDSAFTRGVADMVESTRRAESGANFDGASFGPRA